MMPITQIGRRAWPAIGARSTLRVALIAMAALSGAMPLAAQARIERPGAPAPGDMPQAVWEAQAFVLAAYPDLSERPLSITVRQDADGAVLVSVAEDVAATPGVSAPPLVTARVTFDADIRLTRYDAYGPLLHEAENLALQDQLIAHPRWIDSDADVWLTQQGARSTFGTDFEAAPAARQALEQHLGVTTRATPPAFRWHQEGLQVAPVFRSRPAWVTEASMRAPDGTTRDYAFEYEPFGGRLIAVTTQEAP